jgi:hypothetical protein
MKIRIGANLKSGAPNYGSFGSSAEIELTLDDEITPELAISAMRVWQKAADQVVEEEQARKAARYPQPGQPAPVAAQQPDRLPPAAQPREPRRWDPDSLPPKDGYGGPPAQRNGAGPPARNGSRRDDPPRSGKELIGWANGHQCYDQLMKLAKQANRGRILDWDADMVAWAFADLSHELERSAVGGGWGGRN